MARFELTTPASKTVLYQQLEGHTRPIGRLTGPEGAVITFPFREGKISSDFASKNSAAVNKADLVQKSTNSIRLLLDF